MNKILSINPATGENQGEVIGNSESEVNAACARVGSFFKSLNLFQNNIQSNKALLLALADVLEEKAETIIPIIDSESALGVPRLTGETARTVFQLRAQADLVDTDLLRRKLVDNADSKRIPPLSAQTRIEIAVGPVAVFAASNFPLAFGILGGDTASALAAGCPVVVKAHPAHPKSGVALAEVVSEAIKRAKVDPAWLQVLQGDGPEIGSWIVKHPDIAAVGFTGSRGGGLALKKIADAREVPIPVYAEMSSVNPTFIAPHAGETRASEIGKNWAAILSANAGQLCTKPGIVITTSKKVAEVISESAILALGELSTPPLISPRISNSYKKRLTELIAETGVKVSEIKPANEVGTFVSAAVITISEDDVALNSKITEEIFGPAGVVLHVRDVAEFLNNFEGNLTTTVIMDSEDEEWFKSLMPTMVRNAGRIVFDKWPTGVSVGLATVHGGPYPSTTAPATTSVGYTAAWRFMRPVCFDGFPSELLP